MDIEEFLENIPNSRQTYIKKNYPKLYEDVLQHVELYELGEYKWVIQLYLYLKNLTNIPSCLNCDNLLNITSYRSLKEGFRNKYCSKECQYTPEYNQKRYETIKASVKDKYGVDNVFQSEKIKEKIKETNIEKYGSTSHMHNDEIKEKVKNTTNERYGGVGMGSDVTSKKIKATNLERYGYEYAQLNDVIKAKYIKTTVDRYGGMGNASPRIMEKMKQTMIEKYGISNIFEDVDFIKSKIKDKYGVGIYNKSKLARDKFKESLVNRIGMDLRYDNKTNAYYGNCDIHGEFETYYTLAYNRNSLNIKQCTICNKINGRSLKENDMVNYIRSIYTGEVITKYRDKYEIDCYLPELNIGFEFNGTYWHSDKFKDKNYHIQKNLHFLEKGIYIYHIWEYNWNGILDNVIRLNKFNPEIFDHVYTSLPSYLKVDNHHVIYDEGMIGLNYKNIPCVKNELSSDFNKLVPFISKNDFLNYVNKYSGQKIFDFNDEIDILFDDRNIGFKFINLFEYCELNKDDNHLFEIKNRYDELGINIIMVYEDDWNDSIKNNIIKSRINNLFGDSNRIYARKCAVVELNSKQYRNFLIENHIQGNVNSSIKFGLEYNGELVSVIGFGKLRNNLNSNKDNNDYELLRYCNKLNTTVVGSVSKLIKYVKRNYELDSIISYADRNWSSINNSVYDKIGMELVGYTTIGYSYIIGNKREYRYKYRKDILVKNGYDHNKTAKNIMYENNAFRIYNPGNLKFIL